MGARVVGPDIPGLIAETTGPVSFLPGQNLPFGDPGQSVSIDTFRWTSRCDQVLRLRADRQTHSIGRRDRGEFLCQDSSVRLAGLPPGKSGLASCGIQISAGLPIRIDERNHDLVS